MSSTLSRVMAMLRHIPRHPRKIDTNTLLHRLESAGYNITIRSIQPDLNDLSSIPASGGEQRPAARLVLASGRQSLPLALSSIRRPP